MNMVATIVSVGSAALIKRRWFGVGAPALFLALLISVMWQPAHSAERRDAVAVIIGNSNYAAGMPKVDYAFNDAEAMKRYVIDVLGEGNIAMPGQLRDVFGTKEDHRGRLLTMCATQDPISLDTELA